MLQDLMHRSYNIDKRLAPAFTYTPVYKDPKNSFKLQLSWGPFNGAIPKLERTKKVSFQKLFFNEIHPVASQTLFFSNVYEDDGG